MPVRDLGVLAPKRFPRRVGGGFFAFLDGPGSQIGGRSQTQRRRRDDLRAGVRHAERGLPVGAVQRENDLPVRRGDGFGRPDVQRPETQKGKNIQKGEDFSHDFSPWSNKMEPIPILIDGEIFFKGGRKPVP